VIKLYGLGGTRWVRPYWTAREAGVEFEPVVLNPGRGDTRTPEYLKLHPFAKVPALEDGDFRLFESAAICNYLAEKNPAAGLLPATGTRERALHDQWVSFVISDLEQPLWRVTKHRIAYPEARRSEADIALAKDEWKRFADVLEPLITDHLVGERFTVADIMMAYTLRWATAARLHGENLLARYPRLTAYLARHEARPAFPRELFPAPPPAA
jgi:glutathione S-transferase